MIKRMEEDAANVLCYMASNGLVVGVISAFNRRFYAIRRLKNQVNKKSLSTVVDGLFTSKINYGLQLYGKVRTTNGDPTNGGLDSIQLVQNKLVWFLNGKTLKDQIPTKILLANLNMLSVNQLNAKIKKNEIWKSFNIVR